MLNSKFYPESDHPALITASAEYQSIWDSRGSDFVNALEAQTGLECPQETLSALVYEGVSTSHPLRFRASYTADVKASMLVAFAKSVGTLFERLAVTNEVSPCRNTFSNYHCS